MDSQHASDDRETLTLLSLTLSQKIRHAHAAGDDITFGGATSQPVGQVDRFECTRV
jgi:hypothetical protein